jgi:uncharacterized membrane protein
MTAPAVAKPRLDAPDLLRGIIMVVMLLDHTRDFTHWSSLKFGPTDLAQTSAGLFLTRWVTHFCAPLFVFLAGMAAAFQQQRGKTPAELSAFLFKRGVWLCLVELILIRFLIWWQPLPTVLFLQVIWALGISMMCLAVFVRLPRSVVFVVSAVLVLGHNLFDWVTVAPWSGPADPIPSAAGKLWMFLHQVGPFPSLGWPSPVFYTQYPLIPWMGVMALGWLLGDIYTWEPARRQRTLAALGVSITLAFVVLRFVNVYGDPVAWTAQKTAGFTVLSFLNVTKYPPSLLFLAMTIGPGLVALARLERSQPSGAFARALITFGRVPLFFYVLQWVYAKTAAFTLAKIAGRETALFTQYPPEWHWTPRVGFSLYVTYAVWISGVVILYFPCRWFAGVKARRRDWWLSYL